MPVVRGPLDDVLERYRLAAEQAGCDGVVRITSDCPLVEPDADRPAGRHAGAADDALDYVWNTREPRTFPDGLDVEVVSRRALEEAAAETAEPYDREHVTPFVRDRPERFPQRDLRLEPPVREVKLSLDTPEDLETIRSVHRRAWGPTRTSTRSSPPRVAAPRGWWRVEPAGRVRGRRARDRRGTTPRT